MNLGTCRHCGGELIESFENVPPPAYSRIECRECHRYARWGKTPMSAERLDGFVWPLPKFHGLTLAQINKTPEGRDYLKWVRDEYRGKNKSIKKVVTAFLAWPRDDKFRLVAREDVQVPPCPVCDVPSQPHHGKRRCPKCYLIFDETRPGGRSEHR
jgi:hypothetical protein